MSEHAREDQLKRQVETLRLMLRQAQDRIDSLSMEPRARLLDGPAPEQLPDACPEHDYMQAWREACRKGTADVPRTLADRAYVRGWYDGYVALRNALTETTTQESGRNE